MSYASAAAVALPLKDRASWCGLAGSTLARPSQIAFPRASDAVSSTSDRRGSAPFLVSDRAMVVQVQKVEKGQTALQASFDRVLELSRMRIGSSPPGTTTNVSSADPPQAGPTFGRLASAPAGSASADGFNIFAQGFEDEQPRGKLIAFHSSVVAQPPPAAGTGARELIGPAASSNAVFFGPQDQALHFLHEVCALPQGVRFSAGDAAGDIITFTPQLSSEPTPYGRARSPV